MRSNTHSRKSRPVHFLIALFVLGFSGASFAGPVFFNSGAGATGNAYEFVAGSITWTDANSAANSSSFLGQAGHLVTIASAEENAFLTTLYGDGPGLVFGPWIGLSDQNSDGTYEWVTGETLTAGDYSNWASGEPNNPAELYVHLWHDFGSPSQPKGSWNDWLPTGLASGYIVEYDFSTVPEPETAFLLMAGFLVLARRRRPRIA